MRTYRAYTMAEALEAVKRDLGADAAIVHTRTFKRGGVLGLWRKTVVEVTASRAEDAPSHLRRGRPPRTAPAAASASPIASPAARPNTAARAAYAGASAGAGSAEIQPTAPGASQRRLNNLDARKLDLLAAIEQHRRAQEQSGPPQAASTAPGGTSVNGQHTSGSIEPKTPGASGPDRAQLRRDLAGPPPGHSPLRHGASAIGSPQTEVSPSISPRDSEDVLAAPGDEDEAQRRPVSRVARRFVLRDPAKAQPQVQARAADTPLNQRDVVRPDDEAEHAEPNAVMSEVEVKKILGAVEQTNREAAAVQSEMHAIREMVGRLLERQESGPTLSSRLLVARMPRELVEVYERLRAQDLSERLAQRVVERVQQMVGGTVGVGGWGESSGDSEALRRATVAALADLVPVVDRSTSGALGFDAAPGARPLTIALIGPTGVGKTTTVAKLAATFKLRYGRRVGLVTSDTYRIAAVDQLRAYAQIIGLPLKVVLTPAEMVEACMQLRDCEVILIDTAGRAPRDRGKLDELSAFIDAADPHEVHLVLSATASERVLQQEIDSFARVRADRLILTKLDEAATFGGLLNVVRRVGKPVSFITTGQEVPQHFEEARAERLAELVLSGNLEPCHDLKEDETTARVDGARQRGADAHGEALGTRADAGVVRSARATGHETLQLQPEAAD